jgi:hypothetical protein
MHIQLRRVLANSAETPAGDIKHEAPFFPWKDLPNVVVFGWEDTFHATSIHPNPFVPWRYASGVFFLVVLMEAVARFCKLVARYGP